MSDRPELGAALDHLCLQSAQPQALAEFLELAYAMKRTPFESGWQCTAPDRSILVREGKPNSIAFFSYAFESRERLKAHRRALAQKGLAERANPSPLFDESAHAFQDPDGNVVAFGLRTRSSNDSNEPLPARLQHLGLRTPRIEAMVAFYESLGFVVSDRVQCDEGMLRACFLRTDHEHHALALFRAPDSRFDHISCETRDIAGVVAWADRMAKDGIPIHWGIGRHGPGNDVFFMVKDPDGNLVEISADIEVCEVARPAGTWKHEQRTLNLWGTAIMRS